LSVSILKLTAKKSKNKWLIQLIHMDTIKVDAYFWYVHAFRWGKGFQWLAWIC